MHNSTHWVVRPRAKTGLANFPLYAKKRVDALAGKLLPSQHPIDELYADHPAHSLHMQ
jgi:hypothetical protein